MPLVLSGEGDIGPISATELSYLDGATSNIQSQVSNLGMRLVASQSFSGLSSVQINNCFSSLYDNYKILLTIDTVAAGAANQYVWWRLVLNGAQETSATYNSGNSFVGMNTTGSGGNANRSALNRGLLAEVVGNSGTISQYNGFFGEYTLANPSRSGFLKRLIGSHITQQTSFLEYFYTIGSAFNGSTQAYDGFAFGTDSSALISGKIKIYGLRD